MPDKLNKGDRIIHNDSVLYGAPRSPDTMGVVESITEENGHKVIVVKYDNGSIGKHMDGLRMDIRKDWGGAVESMQTDEEASDLAKLDGV